MEGKRRGGGGYRLWKEKMEGTREKSDGEVYRLCAKNYHVSIELVSFGSDEADSY